MRVFGGFHFLRGFECNILQRMALSPILPRPDMPTNHLLAPCSLTTPFQTSENDRTPLVFRLLQPSSPEAASRSTQGQQAVNYEDEKAHIIKQVKPTATDARPTAILVP